MEMNNLPSGIPFGVMELQSYPMQAHHAQSQLQQFSFYGDNQIGCQLLPDLLPHVNTGPSFAVNNNSGLGSQGMNSIKNDDEQSLTEGAHNGQIVESKKDSSWQRVKWTNTMVRLLVTAASYVDEDVASDFGANGARKSAMLKKKGKWKAISKVLGERGCHVTPQQCEDKFNDLNKRYKRLTDILGRGTACKVVENQALLDQMSHLSDKAKDVARKILSSKHLHYEEMCSYHNRNHVSLPPDPALRRALLVALRIKAKNDTGRDSLEEVNAENQVIDSDVGEDDEDYPWTNPAYQSTYMDNTKQNKDVLTNCSASQDCTTDLPSESIAVDTNHVLSEGCKSNMLLRLEEQALHIQNKMLELERQRFRWKRFSNKKNMDLEKMRLQNERMKLENDRIMMEIKQKEFELDQKLKNRV